MKRATSWAASLAAALLLVPGTVPLAEAQCGICQSYKTCKAGNWAQCEIVTLGDGRVFCSEKPAECAWVYDTGEVAADGSLALARAGEEEGEADREGRTRGCHGLIVARSYTRDAAAALRARTARIVI
jgi:hypothetical protein